MERLKTRRIRDKEGKIQLIFTTFAELVNKKGYDKLSTRHIAKAANISVGTIYHYFPGGKHAIASGFIDHVTHAIFDPQLFELDNQKLPDAFETLIRKYLNTHRKNLEIHRAIDQAILASPEVFETHQKTVTNNLQHVIDELKNADLYKEYPEQVVLQSFTLFYNIMEAVIHRHLFFHPFFETDREVIQFLVDILLFVTRHKVSFGNPKKETAFSI